jgi:Cyclic nucleotide-binding domain
MGLVREVLRAASVRRISLGWGCSVVGELASTIALMIFAFDRGGAALVGVYGLARTLPGAVVAPMVMNLSVRVRVERLLLWATALRAVLLAAAAVAAGVRGPAALVIALAAGSSILASTYRPLMISVMPWLVSSPAQLAAANVVATTTESSGSLLGPFVASVLLTLGPPWLTMAVAAGVLTVAAIGVAGVRSEQQVSGAAGGPGVLRDTWRGLRDLAGVAPPAGMAVLLFAQTFVKGALSVLAVVLAVDVFGAGTPAVGWLYVAMGVGGLAGGAAASAVVHANRLGRAFVAGLFLWGAPLVLLAPAPALWPAVAAFLVVGAGNAIQDVGGGTLTPRLFGPAVLGRVLGAEELVVFAGAGLGALAAAPLIGAVGPRGCLLALGSGLLALAGGYAIRFLQIDRTLPAADPHADLVRGSAIFAPLPLAAVDLLVTRLTHKEYPAGSQVIREGEAGSDYQLVLDGSADVSVRGVARRALGPGDGFGEIALLRDTPRTATVVATTGLRTLSLERADFLAAVTGNPRSLASARELALTTLAGDPPADGRPA